MGMGYSADSKIVIEVEGIEKLEISSFKILMDALEEKGTTLDRFSHCIEYDSDIDELYGDHTEELVNLLLNFCNDFKTETGVGIELRHHDKEEYGSIYDEVDGAHFSLVESDLYQLVEKGALLKEKAGFEHKFSVHYG